MCSPPAVLQCPLCDAGNPASPYVCDKRRCYYRCLRCDLIWVDPADYLSRAGEKAEYDLHENSPQDPAYRRFLSRLAMPLMECLPQRASGLDFGCGPGPALALMLREQGYKMALYDLFYFDNKALLEERYDFITATEVFEHLHKPQQVIAQLWGSLETGGILGIMTKLAGDQAAFEKWHYKNDPTHVCFYSRETFGWLAKWLEAELEFVGPDVIFLRKMGAERTCV